MFPVFSLVKIMLGFLFYFMSFHFLENTPEGKYFHSDVTFKCRLDNRGVFGLQCQIFPFVDLANRFSFYGFALKYLVTSRLY